MHQILKGFLGAILAVSMFCTIPLAFFPELQNSVWSWLAPVISGIIGVGAIAGLLALHFRRPIAPDFLLQTARVFFDSGGFCFGLMTKSDQGVCAIHIVFQNRFDRPCQARVALRPALSFFLARAKIPTIGVDITCPPAAFGVVRIPCPVPKEYQGSKQRFDVGAHCHYPQGKGKMLRFRPGLKLRGSADFQNPFGAAVSPIGLAVGHISISSPASATVMIPNDVAETIDESVPIVQEVLWKLGDPVAQGGVGSTTSKS